MEEFNLKKYLAEGMLREENGSDDLVDGLIEKLKNADLDGETLQYVLEKIGMDYQMYKQLNVKYDNEDDRYELDGSSVGDGKYEDEESELQKEEISFGDAGTDKRSGQVIGEIIQMIRDTGIDPSDVLEEVGQEFGIAFEFGRG